MPSVTEVLNSLEVCRACGAVSECRAIPRRPPSSWDTFFDVQPSFVYECADRDGCHERTLRAFERGASSLAGCAKPNVPPSTRLTDRPETEDERRLLRFVRAVFGDPTMIRPARASAKIEDGALKKRKRK